MNRRDFLAVSVPALSALPLLAADEKSSGITAAQALKEIQEGNVRFVSGKTKRPNASLDRVKLTGSQGQHPHTAIITCADSRVPPEILFDQGIGDVFTVRVAGNVSNNDEVASIEYAVEHLGASLCVVMGHSSCGAVKAIVDGGDYPADLVKLTADIQTAKKNTQQANPNLKGDALLNATIRTNVLLSLEHLIRNGAATRAALKAGKIMAVAAVYDVATGKVEWLGPHPNQAKLV